MRLILASTSATRAAMLREAGVGVETEAPHVDEAAFKAAGRSAGNSAADVAMELARAKALAVSARYPAALVIGADQMLDCGGEWLDKPRDPGGATEQLRRLAGRAHTLETGAACALDGEIAWSHGTRATLVMRPLSDTFIADYLKREGPAALGSVGAYRLEGRGAQLFDRVEGDFFSILGLPLLALLKFLRQAGVLPS